MKIKGLRWVVLSLILIVTIINYLDRGTLNYMFITNQRVTTEQGIETVEKKGIAIDLGLVDRDAAPEVQQQQAKEQLALISMLFMIAYGISQLFSGKLYDKIGTRKGFVFSALLWGASDALASLAGGFKSLSFFRMSLGLGEAGPWPGTTKSNAEWFPQKERALAQGLFGAAASTGSILAPIIIPLIYLAAGWRWTFVAVGSLGIIWVLPWLLINKKGPKDHPWITDKERQYILEGQPECHVTNDKAQSWGQLLRDKRNWSIILGRFFLDPIWWMFVTWLPIYLMEVFQLDIKQVAMSAWVPYLGAAIGSILGGWFSGWLIRRGKSVNYSRKCAMVVGACIILPAMLGAALAPSVLFAVVMMAFVLGGYQFVMTNIQTLASDLHTGKTVGSLAGIGGAAAVCGTLCCMYLVPMLTKTSWVGFFIMLASLVPLSLLSIFLCVKEIKQINQ